MSDKSPCKAVDPSVGPLTPGEGVSAGSVAHGPNGTHLSAPAAVNGVHSGCGALGRRVAGIDFSLSNAGVARLTRRAETVLADFDEIKSVGKRADSLVERHSRLVRHAGRIVDAAADPDLVVIEGPAFSRSVGSAVDRHGCWWMIVSAFMRREVPVAVVVPTALKAAVAGKGGADKAAMAGAVTRLYPDLILPSSDVADAVACAHIGAVRLGWPVKTLAPHRAVKCAWPDFVADVTLVPS